jgi:hypothetical protein
MGSPENHKAKFIANHQTLGSALDELADLLRKESEEPEVVVKKKKKKQRD